VGPSRPRPLCRLPLFFRQIKSGIFPRPGENSPAPAKSRAAEKGRKLIRNKRPPTHPPKHPTDSWYPQPRFPRHKGFPGPQAFLGPSQPPQPNPGENGRAGGPKCLGVTTIGRWLFLPKTTKKPLLRAPDEEGQSKTEGPTGPPPPLERREERSKGPGKNQVPGNPPVSRTASNPSIPNVHQVPINRPPVPFVNNPWSPKEQALHAPKPHCLGGVRVEFIIPQQSAQVTAPGPPLTFPLPEPGGRGGSPWPPLDPSHDVFSPRLKRGFF